jgi:hypothetical protein
MEPRGTSSSQSRSRNRQFQKSQGGTDMTLESREATAREEIGRILAGLEEVQASLRSVQENLPEPSAESFRLLDVEDMDGCMEIRAVIGCVLTDRIGPAIRDLQGVASPRERT